MQLVHDVPGRFRFRSAKLKGDGRNAAILRGRVRALSGVTEASLNPVTGSLIVNYETTEGTREAILRDLEVLVQGPIAAAARPVLRRAPARPPQPVEFPEIIADMLAERLVAWAVRMMVTALI